MIPGSMEYHRPRTVDEAIAMLAEYGDDGRPLAGGQSLIAMMKLRMAQPAHVVDLQSVGELKGMRVDGDTLEVGPMTTQAEIIASDLLANRCPILRETALMIADPQVRYMGTVGGNVANGDPGNDMPAVMMCLDATYMLRGPDGERTVAARDFYEAAYFTALAEGELLTAIRIPLPAAGHGYAYEKLKRKVGDYATAAAAVLLVMSGGVCRRASLALTNLGQTPLLADAAATALVGTSVDGPAMKAAAAQAMSIVDPVEDLRGTREYRTAMAGVMIERAIGKALSRARQ